MSLAPASETAADLTARIRRKLQRQHFMHLIGADLTTIESGRVQAELPLLQQHQQQRGFAHGGLVATMADLVAGFAGVTLIPEDHGLVTVELKVSYLHPGLGDKLIATGWVLKAGRRLHFCEAEVRAFGGENPEEGLLIAKATATMAVIEPAPVDFK
ncbi:PaaI family thioesterase [Hymenobacter koreensis]|uniref:PaaI family thioesterase n=1 Tax=Hymenobacter koreensis TaxID=1084523 RepID=A0ABP8J3L7_9BACT